MSYEINEGWMRIYPVMNIKRKNQEYAFQNVISPKFLPHYHVTFSTEEWEEFKKENNPTDNSLTTRLVCETGLNLLLNPSMDLMKDKEHEYKESLKSEINELKSQLEVEKNRFTKKVDMFVNDYVQEYASQKDEEGSI